MVNLTCDSVFAAWPILHKYSFYASLALSASLQYLPLARDSRRPDLNCAPHCGTVRALRRLFGDSKVKNAADTSLSDESDQLSEPCSLLITCKHL